MKLIPVYLENDRALYPIWYEETRTLKIDLATPVKGKPGRYTDVKDFVEIKVSTDQTSDQTHQLEAFIEKNSLTGDPAQKLMQSIADSGIRLV